MLFHRLRDACCCYPRDAIANALAAALDGEVADTNDRHVLAVLIAAWLSDDEAAAEEPPLTSATVAAVLRELQARAH
jgi:hypothetical protein